MYCKKCGTEIDDDSIVCKVCGTPTGNGNLESRVVKKKKILPIIIIVILIAAGIGGYFFIQNNKKSSLSTEEKYIVGQWTMTVDYPHYSDEYTININSNHTGEVVYTSNKDKVYGTFTWTYEEENQEQDDNEDSTDYISYDIVFTVGDDEANGSIQYFEETEGSSESINFIFVGDDDSGIWIFEDKTSL